MMRSATSALDMSGSSSVAPEGSSRVTWLVSTSKPEPAAATADEIKAVVDTAIKEFGDLHIVVCCAGILRADGLSVLG